MLLDEAKIYNVFPHDLQGGGKVPKFSVTGAMSLISRYPTGLTAETKTWFIFGSQSIRSWTAYMKPSSSRDPCTVATSLFNPVR